MLLSKNRVIRRRAVVGLLIVASLAILSLSYRQGSAGAVGDVQRSVSTVTTPAAGVVHQITQPFADAWNWTTGLINARDEAARVQSLKAQLSEQIVLANSYRQRLAAAQALLHFKNSRRLRHGRRHGGHPQRGPQQRAGRDQPGNLRGDHRRRSGGRPLVPRQKTQNQAYSGALVGVVSPAAGPTPPRCS